MICPESLCYGGARAPRIGDGVPTCSIRFAASLGFCMCSCGCTWVLCLQPLALNPDHLGYVDTSS